MNREQNMRDVLIEAGRREFLENGYEKASLRKISKAAGASTGAIYFFFKNKEDFFASVVSETAKYLKVLIAKQTEAEFNGEKTSAESEREVLEYIYKNRDTVAILLEKAENSPYKSFKNELCTLLERGYLQFFEKFGGDTKNSEIAKIIAKMRIQGHIALINGGYDPETMFKYSKLLAIYGDCGFIGLMKQYNAEKGSVE